MIEFFQENSLVILLFIGTLFSSIWLCINREKLKINYIVAVLLGILHTVVGLMCVKVFAVLETMDFSNIENMSLFGAIFFLPIVYLLAAKLTKRDCASVFDVFTPCTVFTLFCARINCLFSGCCLGRYIPGIVGGARFPTRELEILFYVILLIYFIKNNHKDRIPGLYYPVYMIAYGVFRFFCEGFREANINSIIHISHIWAIFSFCIGMSIYLELRKNKKGRKTKC